VSAPRYVCGLDLGQTADPTAFAAVEQTTLPDPDRPRATVSHYAVRHLERLPLGTPYPAVVERVRVLMADPPLAGCPLAVDQTGVGRPVVDMLRAARVRCWLRPVTISGGASVSEDAKTRELTVPKRDLVGAVVVPLQGRRLKIAATLPDAATLAREMAAFRVKITAAANETFGAWREGQHDDLVLAVAMAVWLAERLYPAGGYTIGLPPKGQRSVLDTLPENY
jgi:hypothetical protein